MNPNAQLTHNGENFPVRLSEFAMLGLQRTEEMMNEMQHIHPPSGYVASREYFQHMANHLPLLAEAFLSLGMKGSDFDHEIVVKSIQEKTYLSYRAFVEMQSKTHGKKLRFH